MVEEYAPEAPLAPLEVRGRTLVSLTSLGTELNLPRGLQPASLLQRRRRSMRDLLDGLMTAP